MITYYILYFILGAFMACAYAILLLGKKYTLTPNDPSERIRIVLKAPDHFRNEPYAGKE
jgi:hypothetical protein